MVDLLQFATSTAHARSAASGISLDDKVAFLRQPQHYPEATHTVDTIETHMSWVFLTSTRAYKLKKPIRYRSLDYRSLDARRKNCEQELTLNRRLAPDVYLGVIPLTLDEHGNLHIGGYGEVIDWLVEMKRLPETCTLEYLLRTRGATATEIQLAGMRLSQFFRQAPPVDFVSADQVRSKLRREISETRDALMQKAYGIPAEPARFISVTLRAYLAANRTLFRERVRAGRFIEGHGDLRPEHIYICKNGAADIVITDCLEFDARLRILDPIDELAFLGMECERLGEPRAIYWLYDTYQRVSGDHPPSSMREFYASFRAYTRARSSIEHLDRPGIANPARWRNRTLRYLELSRSHAEHVRGNSSS